MIRTNQKAEASRSFWYVLIAVLFLAAGMGFFGTREVHADTTKVTVQYRSNSGLTNSRFQALTQTVVKGTKVKLASLPVLNGYRAMGWTRTKGSPTAEFAAGTVATVKNHVTLYAVYRRYPCTVKFNNFYGTSTSTVFTSLNRYAPLNYYITLPELPKASGYTAVGWSTVKGSAAKLYQPGTKYKVTGNVEFYGVYRRNVYCTVSFYNMGGLTSSKYKALEKRVLMGSSITLPSVPARTGYVNLGWSTTKNASSARWSQGQKVKVTKDCKLYAVQKVGVSVILHNYSGEPFKTTTIAYGNYFRLPTEKNSSGYTFMGWSTAKDVTLPSSGYYMPGSTVKVTGTLKLYPIRFQKSKEKDFQEYEITELTEKLFHSESGKYRNAIFIGDSRTNRTMETLVKQFGTDSSALKNVSFIPGEGQGLSWLKETAYPKLISMLKAQGTSSRPTAVIVRLGANDLKSTSLSSSIASQYVSYLTKMASALKSYNCRVFVVSVNPVNSKMTAAAGKTPRYEKDVLAFNKAVKAGLSGTDCSYINSYNWLMKYGYSFDTGHGVDTGVDDGLHYSTRTYKSIYYYCLNRIYILG